MKVILELDTTKPAEVKYSMDVIKSFSESGQPQQRELPAGASEDKGSDKAAEMGSLLDKLKQENESLKSQCQKYKTLLDESRSAAEKLLDQKKTLEEKHTKEIETLKKEIEAAGSAPKEECVSKEEHERIVERFNRDIEFHKNRSDKNFEELKKLRQVIDTMKIEKANSEKKCKTETAELLKQIEDLKALGDAPSPDMDAKVAEYEMEIERLTSQLQLQKENFEQAEEQLTRNKSLADSLNNEKRMLENSINKYKADVEALKQQISQQKPNDSSVRELEYFRAIRDFVYSQKSGQAFWENLENQAEARKTDD